MAKKSNIGDVAKAVADRLSQKFKTDRIAFVQPHKHDHPSKVKTWVSTGCRMLDIAISNLPDKGGFPSGRLSILYGPEQSGKSLMVAHAIANVQRVGGIGILIDTEASFSDQFAEAIGVNLEENFIYIPVVELEKIFQIIYEVIFTTRKNNPDVPIVIAVDSIAGTLTAGSMTKTDFSVSGYNTDKARILSEHLPALINAIADHDIIMIFTNQVRQKMNLTNIYENPYRMPHGKALEHAASLILQTNSSKAIKQTIRKGWDREIGKALKVKVVKNRMGPPNDVISFDIFYDRGIDDMGSLVDYGVLFEIVSRNGAWYSMDYVDDETGEVINVKGQGKYGFIEELLKNSKTVDFLWSSIAKLYIRTYVNTKDSANDTEC